MTIVLDVVKAFPTGWPAEGDVVVLDPGRSDHRVSLLRYPSDPQVELELIQYADRLACRESDCPRCPLLEVCPSPHRLLRVVR